MASLGLVFPDCEDPKSFVKQNASSKLMQFDKGTTTLAFRYQGGVMVACDSRASQGSFVASQTVQKVIEINDYLLGTMAGGAADCSFWERYLSVLCRMHELRQSKRITVAHASNLLANIFWEYRGRGLQCGTMVTGYDDSTDSTSLYYVSDDGSRIQGDLFSVGSGSTYAYGVLDTYYRWDLSDQDALELAKRAIYHAAHRDGGSGGVVRVYHVHKNGWSKLIQAEDFFDLHKHYSNEILKIDPTKPHNHMIQAPEVAQTL
ncbi:proteasome subunit beta type [Gregarina niphandrodes]|uniref:Proteasome subunit beta n=1 Tax=Gregarina niphandrodes TaxID=110365 RepID=A0A023B3F0_GRENI|nr:proteasome subunit beta type [Gregarina niphandrodes]EZG55442.1 proteasome subunit beta type [Gregarina niphandrodes]|eukprot:XP_011131553.1 proteasome subunit beta type [Gregarina niphandrodes]